MLQPSRSKLSADRRYKEQAERNHYLRVVTLKPQRWYVACSMVDPERIRRDYQQEIFSILRARGITGEERARIRKLVSDEQKKRYRLNRRIERSGY